MTSAYDTFMSKIPSYNKFNYLIIAMASLQFFLLLSLIPSHLICHQALPIAIFNITTELLTVLMPIACIMSANALKHFNSVLAYCILICIAKTTQILVLLIFNHTGTCALPAIDRIPIAVFSALELMAVLISSWILKRIRRVDRENKAVSIIKSKQFLSD